MLSIMIKLQEYMILKDNGMNYGGKLEYQQNNITKTLYCENNIDCFNKLSRLFNKGDNIVELIPNFGNDIKIKPMMITLQSFTVIFSGCFINTFLFLKYEENNII
jgi:hypothetical protein